MPTTQPITSANVLDFRGQEKVQIEGRSCLTVAYKRHMEALGAFREQPESNPLAQMIVAWARYADNYKTLNGLGIMETGGYAWFETGKALLMMVRFSHMSFDRESLKQGILGVLQSQGVDTENL